MKLKYSLLFVVVILAVIIVFILFLFFYFINVKPFSRAPSLRPSLSQEELKELTFSSFTDLFSGVGWIDQTKTTLYQDRNITAFLFPPKFDFEKLENESSLAAIKQLQFASRQSDGGDVRCLKNKCLVQKDLNLFLEQDGDTRQIDLPSEIKEKNLINVSIGMLDNIWLVGAVEKLNNQYQGKVFYFDGTKFSEVSYPKNEDDLFISKYPGIIGFGGTDNDWLAIYGAYEGMAYRILNPSGLANKDEAVKFQDISRFFGIRVLNEGFQPLVLRAGSGRNTHWYVFNLNKGNPKLIKLFQNKTDEIVGATDLTPLFMPAEIESSSFAVQEVNLGFLKSLFSEENILLAAKLKKLDGKEELWQFRDWGFDKTKPTQITSLNINNYSAEVRTAKIEKLDLTNQGAKMRPVRNLIINKFLQQKKAEGDFAEYKSINTNSAELSNVVNFFLSNNAADWIEANLGQEIVFPQKNGRGLFWRAEFEPDNDSLTSPFLDTLTLHYYVKFLRPVAQ